MKLSLWHKRPMSVLNQEPASISTLETLRPVGYLRTKSDGREQWSRAAPVRGVRFRSHRLRGGWSVVRGRSGGGKIGAE